MSYSTIIYLWIYIYNILATLVDGAKEAVICFLSWLVFIPLLY